jgi:hypothetical protein
MQTTIRRHPGDGGKKHARIVTETPTRALFAGSALVTRAAQRSVLFV